MNILLMVLLRVRENNWPEKNITIEKYMTKVDKVFSLTSF